MKKQTFLSGVLILFIAGIIAKILGAVYRIPLTWLLGAEGLGMYQLVYPLFSLILVLSSTGMPTAISRVTAEYAAKGDFASARITLKQSLKLLLSIGTVFAILLAASAYFISSLQGNPNLYICYLGLVPAVILVSILSAFRGYFQGCSNMVPTATSQLIEQGGKLILGLLCGYFFIGYGVEYGTFGALIGVSASELLATLVMLIFYQKDRKMRYYSAQNELHSTVHSTPKVVNHAKKKELQGATQPNKSLSQEIGKPPYLERRKAEEKTLERTVRKKIISNVIPITLSNAILPTVLFVESLFIVALLSHSGLDTLTATTLWGINSGVVGSLINMPIVLTQSVAIAIVPFVATLLDTSALQNRYNQAYGLSLTFCTPIIIAFALLGEPILSILYQTSLTPAELTLATQMLLIMCVSIIFGSLLQTQNNMLQGLGYGSVTARNMAIAAAIQIVLFVSLSLTNLNIWGCIIASIAFYFIAYLLNYIFIRGKLKLKIFFNTIYPVIGGGVLLSLYIVNIILLGLNPLLTLILAVAGGGVLYVFGVWVWGGADKLGLHLKRKKQV